MTTSEVGDAHGPWRRAELRTPMRAHAAGSELDASAIVRELDLRRVELELRRDALSSLQRELEEGLDRYCDLLEPSRLTPTITARGVTDGAAGLSGEPSARALLELDAELGIRWSGAGAQRLFGYAPAELAGRSLFMLLPALGDPGALDAARTIAGALLQGRRANGSTFPLELRLGALPGAGEGALLALARDVSERERVRRLLRASDERFLDIARHVEDVFVVQEHDESVSYVSPAYTRVLGRDAGDALTASAERWLGLLVEDDRERARRAHAAAWAGLAGDEELRTVRPDGELRWLRARIFPVMSPSGVVQRVIAVAQDVTASKRLQRELDHAGRVEAIGRLAAGVAHDFNNVLMGILGSAHMALRDTTPPERARAYVEDVARAAKRGATLAAQLLAFGKRREPSAQPSELDRVVRGATSLLARLVGEHVSVRAELGAAGSLVVADPAQIEQILLNLAANARDAMPRGGRLTVRTRARSLDPRWTAPAPRGLVALEVEDDGAGMDEATRERAFEPFFTTRGEVGGSGLGLSTVLALVQQLSGRIFVDSTLGLGTTFTVLLPCTEAGATRLALAAPRTTALTGPVLVVEDDALVRGVICAFLRELGLEPIEADGEAAALRALADAPKGIDALVCDVLLPASTGPRLVELLRKERPLLPALYISGHPKADLVQRGLLEESATFLAKPFARDALAVALAPLLPGPIAVAAK